MSSTECDDTNGEISQEKGWLWKTVQIWTIHPHSYGYKIILTHNPNPAYLHDV